MILKEILMTMKQITVIHEMHNIFQMSQKFMMNQKMMSFSAI